MVDLADNRILLNLDRNPEPVTRQTRAGLISLHLAATTLAAWVGSGNPLWIVVVAPLVIGPLLLAGTRGRVAEVKEVLVNLLDNARAALPGGGQVKVEIESVEG